jgi:pimeloyl-ACP methyl ester carboxylesterase
LSYLGLGTAEPTPSRGLMLSGLAPSYAEKALWTAALPGLAISSLEWGNPSSPTLLALHGLRGHGHSWDSFSEPMSGEHRILTLDQRGRGASDWAPDGQYTSEAYVKDLEGFCEALQLQNIVLMGHSMGGRNSMVFTARHPSMVNRLIIVDIGPEGDPRGTARIKRETVAAQEEYISFEELFEAQQKSNPLLSPEVLRRRLTYQTKTLPNGKIGWRYDVEIRRQWREDRRPPQDDLWPAIANIPCPTLIVRGTETDVLPVQVAQRMVQGMPKAQLAHVERAAHMVMEENPEGFLRAVRDFLESTA